MAITLREGLGRKLTIAEMDENFTFLSGSYVVNSITSSMTVGNASSASVAARATLLSPAATESFADSATTASHAVTAASASYAISASHEISYETSSSLAETFLSWSVNACEALCAHDAVPNKLPVIEPFTLRLPDMP